MKFSLIIVIILKLVNCAIIYSENANLNNVRKNSFDFHGSNVITTSEFHKTKYEDKRHYFCSVCLNKALCKEKEKCYMCTKYCKNFKKLQKHPKFEIVPEVNFHPDGKKLNTNSTPGTEFTIAYKMENDILTKLLNYVVQSALIKMSTIPKKTSIRAGFKQENLQTMNNSFQAEEKVIANNLIELNKNNENNNIDIRSLPYNARQKRNSNTSNQPNEETHVNPLQKRYLPPIGINNTQIAQENFNSARPYGGPFRKFNFPDSDINKTPLLSNNKREEHSDELLKHIEDQSINRNQKIANTGGSIFPVNESTKQIPLITNRNQVPQFDVNQNNRILNTAINAINSQPFTVNDGQDAILSSPLLFNNNEKKTCDENLNGVSAVDGNAFSLLQNLEKKIENIADLIKQGCNYNDLLKSENQENSNGLRLNKNKIKLPALPNELFGQPRNKNNKDRANAFPNRIMQIPQNEDGDESESQKPVNDDKILRDINPELFSENDDENSDQFTTDNLNEDELANNENVPDTIQKNKLESPTPIPFRNQFRLRKNPLQNDQNKPLISELLKKRVDSKPNLFNRFANLDNNDEQIPEENGNSYEPEEAFEPGVPWSNNGERSNVLPKSKPHIPKTKVMPRNNLKDRLKNNALPLQPRENFKPALSHLNNFISKLNDAPFQKLPKANPPWNRIANPDIPKLHFPLNKLDADRPGRIPMQRINSKPQNAISDEQPKTRSFLLPKDRPSKLPNLPLIHQRFGEQDDSDPSVPLGSSINNYEQNPNTFLGNVVIPQQNGNDDIENKKIFFEGTGVNLPLTIKKNPEGTYKVSLAVDNICNACNEKSCNLKEGLVGATHSQESIKSPLKYKDLNDNVQNLSAPKNEFGASPQGETNNKFANVRESNNEEIPEIKSRLFDKEHNLFNRRRYNDGVELKPKPSLLFPRLSQIAKRSPSLLFDSPLLKLGGNYLDSGYSADFKNKGNGLNMFDGKNGESKKVALMKDMLTWMKNVAEENTA